MVTQKDHMVGVIANTLLYSEAAQDELIRLLWERMTDEQKQALTDEAHRAALERMAKIVESRIYAIGTGDRYHGRVNFFPRHVEAAVKRAFEAENISAEITRIVQEQLDTTKSGLRDAVVASVNVMTRSLVKGILSGVDVYSIRDALQNTLKTIKFGDATDSEG